MKKFYLMLLVSLTFNYAIGQVEGTWKLAPEAGAMAVGPNIGDYSWWSNGDADVSTRACLFDDEYVFNSDGSFENKLGTETWLEPWQGQDPEACGAGIAPHDGSAIASWSYDATAGTITLSGKGAYLGLAKAVNGSELGNPNDAPASVTYPVSLSGDRMTIEMDCGNAKWKFILAKEGEQTEPVGLEGTWQMAPIAGAMAVGPNLGDYSWWSNGDADVTTRACLFDDKFIFNTDGSFEQELDGDTWLEPWQGQDPEGCGTPLAPHDGSAIASWSYDETAGEITLSGKGAHLGLAKAVNGSELANPADAPASVTYPVTFNAGGDTMTIEMDCGNAKWKFVLNKTAEPSTGSVRAFDENLFKVFPNPATNEITVSATDKVNSVSITDVTGKLVFTSSDVTTNHKVDVSSFNRGVYIVEVLSDNKRSVKRVILN